MSMQINLEKCLPFISAESQPVAKPPILPKARRTRLAVTISRQTGSGAHSVGEKLAQYLQACDSDGSSPW